MTITIPPFLLGILATILSEILAFILTVVFVSYRDNARKHRNTSNSSRSDKNE